MGKKGRAGSLPKWYKGRKLLDEVDGSEIYEFDRNLRIQRGIKMHKINFDSLTDQERDEQIIKPRASRKSLGNYGEQRTYIGYGQGQYGYTRYGGQ